MDWIAGGGVRAEAEELRGRIVELTERLAGAGVRLVVARGTAE
jgi:hypothetical protein